MKLELADQIEWEKEMLTFGIQRFRAQQNKAVERKDFTGTNGGRRLLSGYLAQVSEFISHYCAGNSPDGRRRNKFAKLIATVDADKLAMFALSEIVSAVFEDKPAVTVSHQIGTMVEDELRFSTFEEALPDLFKKLRRDLDSRNSESYRHRHRVLTHAMNKENLVWAKWSPTDVIGVGTLVLSLALDATDLVYHETIRRGNKQVVMLKATEAVHDWIINSDEAVAALLPDRMPSVIPPAPWTDTHDGGYYLPRLRMITPLVKTRNGFARPVHKEMLDTASMDRVLAAVNGVQNTAWRVNNPVLRTLQRVWEQNLGVGMPPSMPYVVPPCPVEKGRDLTDTELNTLLVWKQEAREVYSLEKKRRSLVLGVARVMRLGELMKAKELLWFVYQLDFRARMYSATSGLSPQGSDYAKACLEFGDSKRIGERGIYWLKVHGANKYGTDSCSYDNRVAWIDEHRDRWLAVAENPTEYRDYWKDADKPYQFLAFCMEYAGAVKQGADYETRLPIALDGSCNGLQHFSAMLRDATGGAAVNLLPTEVPSDIYADVGGVVTDKLKVLRQSNTQEGVAAANWLALFESLGHEGCPRKLTKTPVMTLPYGSTQQACTKSIFSWYMEHHPDFFDADTRFLHAIFLSKILWVSIGEVVIAARDAMVWVQECSKIMSSAGLPITYTSPLGFPVYQGSRKADVLRVSSRVGGSKLRLNVRVEVDEIDPRKQRQAVSPNLLHDTDGCHLQMCVIAGLAAGIPAFAMVHDDFGVHACFVDKWHVIIREQFVKLHTDNDVLANFKASLEEASGLEMPELPPRGDLDLTEVLKSPYFFG